MNIVSTEKNYTYALMENDLNILMKTYPFLEVFSIGTSVLGKKLYVVRLGIGTNHVFYSASIHANEWITSILLMKFIEVYCNAYSNNSNINGYSIKDIFNSSSIFLMPMVNPDGVDLVSDFISLDSSVLNNVSMIAKKFSNIPFPFGWKANIRGESLINFHLYF